MEYFIIGVAVGYIANPIVRIIAKIFKEAWKSTYGHENSP